MEPDCNEDLRDKQWEKNKRKQRLRNKKRDRKRYDHDKVDRHKNRFWNDDADEYGDRYNR
jgi:hypothetical protein